MSVSLARSVAQLTVGREGRKYETTLLKRAQPTLFSLFTLARFQAPSHYAHTTALLTPTQTLASRRKPRKPSPYPNPSPSQSPAPTTHAPAPAPTLHSTHSLTPASPRDSNRAGPHPLPVPFPCPPGPLRISCPPPSAHLLLRLPRHHNNDSLYCTINPRPQHSHQHPINHHPVASNNRRRYHISTFGRQK
jgi:hypothetical protein